uniref:Transcription termination factor 2 n=1 Tax=Onchocerca volvulus TaxID=6282 RepID=A0A8R1XSM2_ONCVO
MLSNDDMIMKKIEQQAGHENFPSANSCLIPALDLVSPIGKIRQREPGPITSTPRVNATILRDHMCRSDCLEKLSHIHEDIVLSSNEKEPSAKLSSANNISNSSGKDLHSIERVDRSRSILSAVASPLELEKKEKKHGQLMAKNFHEKRKIAWGYVGETADALEIATLADDKVPDSPMQVSTAEHISNMDISTINSTNDKSNLIKENKKMNNCNLNDMFTTSDNSKVREMQEARPKNTSISISLEDEIINDGSCSSFLDEKENTPTSNEIESVNVSSSLSESSIYISNVNSPSEMSNNIEEYALITANELAATSIHDASEDDCQIIDSFSLSHSASTLEFAQKIPSTLSRMELETQLNNLKNLKRSANLSKLPDFGRRLLEKLKILQKKLDSLDAFEKNENVIPNEFIENENVDIIQKKNGPPIISPQAIAGGRRLFGGKMTDNRIYLANAVTGQVIAQMHSSLANIPENVKTDTPTSLLTELMPHQKEGLTWLLWREKQSLPGGILADDMGLGKTLSMISLIVNVKERRMQNAMVIDGSNIKVTKDSYLIPSRATLIVAPASLIFQWEAEFQKHVKSDFLSRYLFYGPKHKRDISAKCLARYDVVITTYGIVSSELTEKFTAANVEDERKSNDTSDSVDGKNGKEKAKRKVSKKSGSALTKIAWERIILDEAHQIKNRTSLVSKACCKIPAATRWCLTGTPIHNNLWDLYSLIRFLRVAPFDEEAVWKEYILSAHSSSQRLNTLVKGLLLRREKNQLCTETNKPIIDLRSRMCEKIVMKLEGIEKKVYDYMFQVSRQQVKELIKTREERERDLYGIKRTNASNKPARNPFLGGSRTIRNNDNFQTMTCVLTLLMRLRQACVHFALINQAVDMEALQTLGIEEDENAELLSEHFSNMSLLDEKAFTTKLLLDNGNKQIEQLFQETFVSTKIKKLFEHVDHALSCGDKCVIVSQWTSLLNILEYHLKRKQISYTSISGKVSSSDRQKRANSFNKIDSGPRVMLLSLTAGGVGLNLVGGNHLFLIDLHWNPALEQQACDRIYRIGQTKNVYIHKLVCLETIEERVLALQQIKETLAKDVLQGVASKKLSKLTIADLKYLFDLGRPHDNLANFGGTICPPKFISASTTSDIDSGSLIANAVVEK